MFTYYIAAIFATFPWFLFSALDFVAAVQMGL